MLRESLGDFERVKGVLGRDTVETIVQAERQREQALKGQKRVQQRKKFRKDDWGTNVLGTIDFVPKKV